MSDKKDLIDTAEEDDVITLLTANGTEVRFIEIAGIAYQGAFYAILQPEEKIEGLGENEGIVFKVTTGSDGQDRFDVVLDDEIIAGVYAEYEKLYAAATGGGDQ